MFQHSAHDLSQTAETVLQLAKLNGATAAEVDLSESLGQSVQVRLQDIEQIEHQQDKSLDITVYVGQRKGRASTADLSPQAIADTVQAACAIARYTAEDDCSGLADANLMAQHIGDLNKYHEWQLSSKQAVELAKQCEQAALDFDARIQNSDGANVSTSHHQFVYANTHGFCQHQRGTCHSISCSLVAADAVGMERDYWYDSDCDAAQMDSVEQIGRIAAQRTVSRLNARSTVSYTHL
ncbi:TldD/PmbA family protein, partial [Kingella kingae]|uniref:TldD/PmbA family protein n=1 Tax=Kingella kingae TaxID=504 RepID=UPI00254B057F